MSTAVKNIKRRSLGKRMWHYKILYLMVLPPIVTVFIFHYIPIYGILMAFQDFRPSLGIWGSEWVGLEHFRTFIEHPNFWNILRNTAVISLFSFTTFPLPIIFAIMLNELRSDKFRKTSQMITYAPHFVSTVVVCSMTLLFVKDDGLINILRGFFGQEAVDFISLPSAFAPIYTISGLWQGLGWGTIIYLAALSGVSPELVEATKMDGGNRLQIIRNVHFPHILPTIVIMFILKMGSLLSVGFEKIFLLQNPLNTEVSSVLATYAYNIGMVGHQYSYSTAVGLFDNIINIILILITNRLAKKFTSGEIGLW